MNDSLFLVFIPSRGTYPLLLLLLAEKDVFQYIKWKSLQPPRVKKRKSMKQARRVIEVIAR